VAHQLEMMVLEQMQALSLCRLKKLSMRSTSWPSAAAARRDASEEATPPVTRNVCASIMALHPLKFHRGKGRPWCPTPEIRPEFLDKQATRFNNLCPAATVNSDGESEPGH